MERLSAEFRCGFNDSIAELDAEVQRSKTQKALGYTKKYIMDNPDLL